MPEACFPQSPAASDKKGESLFLAERKETQPRAQCRTRITSTKTAMPPAPSISRRTIAKPPSVRPPRPQNRRRRQAPARGPAAVYAHHRPNRTETQHTHPLLVGWVCVESEPTALAGGTATPLLVGRACCSLCVIPMQGERKGRFLATLPCPVGARGAAGVRGRRCLPLRGKSASELARRIWAGSWERAFCGAVCPSGGLSRRAGERKAGSYLYRPRFQTAAGGKSLLVGQTGVYFEPTALAAGTAGPAGSARTRSRDQSLENPFLGNGGRFPVAPVPNAAGGRPLLVGLPPSTRFTAPTGPKRRTPAPCSWGGRASIPSQRRCQPALPAPTYSSSVMSCSRIAVAALTPT